MNSGKKLIAVIPDNFPIELYTSTLQLDGIHVISCDSAQTALQYLDAESSATCKNILIVLELGRHNGLELVHEIRSHSDWAYIHIGIITLSSLDVLGLTSFNPQEYAVDFIDDFKNSSTKVIADWVRSSYES